MPGRPKIFIVEDDPENTELFMEILAIGGYECIHSADGERVLEIAKRERPDLVLLDINLPGLDGISIKNILRSTDETKNLKIIALTAYAMKGDREMFLKEGFDGYISKPVKMKEFLSAIENYLCS